MKHKLVPLTEILVENRFRQDLGDIESLKETIQAHGLLQPIVLDENYNLLAGGRRYEACSQLEFLKIPCVIHKLNGQAASSLEVELIENISRKDMLWHERGALEAKIFALKMEADPLWSQQKQAAFLDISKGSVQRRLTLQRALAIVPDLIKCRNEDEAWKTYKRLEEDAVVEVLSERAREAYNAESNDPSDDDQISVDPQGGPHIVYQDVNTDKVLAGFLHNVAMNAFMITDALEALKKNRPECAHFAEVDTPYGIDLDKRKDGIENYNEIPREDYIRVVKEVSDSVYCVLKPDAFMVWWYGQEWYHEVLTTLKSSGFSVSVIPCVWNKDIAGQTRNPDQSFGNSYETFFLCRKGNPKLRKPGRSNVFNFKTVNPSQKIHPTEKPIELMAEIIETTCYPGHYVISPFLGSGVTLRAAYRSLCRGWGYELDQTLKSRFLSRINEDLKEGKIKR